SKEGRLVSRDFSTGLSETIRGSRIRCGCCCSIRKALGAGRREWRNTPHGAWSFLLARRCPPQDAAANPQATGRFGEVQRHRKDRASGPRLHRRVGNANITRFQLPDLRSPQQDPAVLLRRGPKGNRIEQLISYRNRNTRFGFSRVHGCKSGVLKGFSIYVRGSRQQERETGVAALFCA